MAKNCKTGNFRNIYIDLDYVINQLIISILWIHNHETTNQPIQNE